MLKLLSRRRTTAKVEALIRATSLFDREFYLGQTRDASAARDPVRHYVLTGEALGLRPLPLLDPGW